MRLVLRINDGRRHRRVERYAVGMSLVVGHHVHPGIQRGLGPLLGARESTDDAAITLVQDCREQLVLRGVVMQEPRLRNIGGTRDVCKRGCHVALRREKGQRLRQDARLLILATGLRTAGTTGARCLSIVAHTGCSMFTVTELPTTHHSVQPPIRHRVCEHLSSSAHTRCVIGLIRGLSSRSEPRTAACPTHPTRDFHPCRSSPSRSRETSRHVACPSSRCPGS